MKIKVCGNTNQENLESVLQLSPDYVGFIFYEASKRFVKPEKSFRSFVRQINSTHKVGVFVNASLNEIVNRIDEFKLDLIQLQGDELPTICASVSRVVPVIKAFGINQGFDFDRLKNYQAACNYFLFDNSAAGYGGSGQKFDWNLLDDYELDTPFFLSGGIGPDQIHLIKSIKHEALIGIDLNSRFETSAGLKNTHQLETFFHEIRN
jgi:phosphoribosylanthranilate isomerase